MKASELIRELEDFIRDHGDVEVEFLVFDKYHETDNDPEDAYFVKVHDGYNDVHGGLEKVCEIRLELEQSA